MAIWRDLIHDSVNWIWSGRSTAVIVSPQNSERTAQTYCGGFNCGLSNDCQEVLITNNEPAGAICPSGPFCYLLDRSTIQDRSEPTE
jgi:hypothetical protein